MVVERVLCTSGGHGDELWKQLLYIPDDDSTKHVHWNVWNTETCSMDTEIYYIHIIYIYVLIYWFIFIYLYSYNMSWELHVPPNNMSISFINFLEICDRGEVIPRQRRVSLTFRLARGKPCKCPWPTMCDSQCLGDCWVVGLILAVFFKHDSCFEFKIHKVLKHEQWSTPGLFALQWGWNTIPSCICGIIS